MNKSKKSEPTPDGDLVVTYTKIHRADLEELQRRGRITGATVAAQIRILVHEALQGKVIK